MADMTISQALRRARKLKGELAELEARSLRAVYFAQATPPAFPFDASFKRTREVRAELVDLETRIAITNAVTSFAFEGRTTPVIGAVQRLQDYKKQLAWLKTLPCQPQKETKTIASQWSEEQGKNIRVEQTLICSLTEQERDDLVRKLQDAFDSLNDAVETVNHKTPIVSLKA